MTIGVSNNNETLEFKTNNTCRILVSCFLDIVFKIIWFWL